MHTGDADDLELTVTINGTEYELNETAKGAIERRAELAFEDNEYVRTWWKEASPHNYETTADWDDTVHSAGDPVLVIETEGPVVSWDRLDRLDPETERAAASNARDEDATSPDEHDAGNGMRTLDPDDVTGPADNAERIVGRTHFAYAPQSYEEVPSPPGEDEDKIPQEPQSAPSEPLLVAWLPERPEFTHTWGTGRAMLPIYSWVEWNVQAKADQPDLQRDTDTSHTHWEDLMDIFGCETLSESTDSTERDTAATDTTSDNTQSTDDIGGKYGGSNWHV